MDLNKLFAMQSVLDVRIMEEKMLEGENLLPQKILSLQVEIGELANEWRGFKFWSNDTEQRKETLEEYVDCLHFILSIGLETKLKYHEVDWQFYMNNNRKTLDQFLHLYQAIADFAYFGDNQDYCRMLGIFLSLGENLGFNGWEIEQAYMEKNKVNHERQRNGY